MILEISVAVIAFFIVIFVIALLFVFKQIKRTAMEAEKLLDTTRQQITPLSHDLAVIFSDTKKIVQSIQKQVVNVEHGVNELKDTAIRISEFEKVLQEKLEQPIIEFTMLLSVVSKALRLFVEFWRK